MFTTGRRKKPVSSFDHGIGAGVSLVYQTPLAVEDSLVLHRPCWANGRREVFHGAIGRALHREHLKRSGQYRRRPRPAPQRSGDPNDGPKNPQEWFDTSAFSLPALYSFGNAPRNAVIGPGL